VHWQEGRRLAFYSSRKAWELGVYSTLKVVSGFFFGSAGVWIQHLQLIGRHSTIWAIPPAPFQVIFLIVSNFCLGSASDHDLPTYAFCIAGVAVIIGMSCLAQFVGWDWISLTFAQSDLELWSSQALSSEELWFLTWATMPSQNRTFCWEKSKKDWSDS
jgi:hypothetical protein